MPITVHSSRSFIVPTLIYFAYFMGPGTRRTVDNPTWNNFKNLKLKTKTFILFYWQSWSGGSVHRTILHAQARPGTRRFSRFQNFPELAEIVDIQVGVCPTEYQLKMTQSLTAIHCRNLRLPWPFNL